MNVSAIVFRFYCCGALLQGSQLTKKKVDTRIRTAFSYLVGTIDKNA